MRPAKCRSEHPGQNRQGYLIVILALAGDSSTTSLALAWTYCALRIVHSLWQNLVNTIPVRFTLFLLSSLCLLGLALKAVYLTLG